MTPSLQTPTDGSRTVDLFGEEAGQVLNALSSETARSILAHLSDQPATKSDIAEQVDTTIQNAQYHVDRLEAAGVVRIIGTHYSSRGAEMDVYAPSGDPLVLVGGDERRGVDAGDRSRAPGAAAAQSD